VAESDDFYRGRFVVVTTYVHSSVSIAFQVGLYPLNMSGRKTQLSVCVWCYLCRRKGSTSLISFCHSGTGECLECYVVPTGKYLPTSGRLERVNFKVKQFKRRLLPLGTLLDFVP